MISADGTAVYPWNHGEVLTAAGLNAAIMLGFSGQSAAYVSATPPPSPLPGQMWFDPVGAQTYVWYNDGTSSQWVVAVNPPAGNFLPLSGGQLTGPLLLGADGTHPTSVNSAVSKAYVDGGGAGGPFLPLSGGTMSGALGVTYNPPAATAATTMTVQSALGGTLVSGAGTYGVNNILVNADAMNTTTSGPGGADYLYVGGTASAGFTGNRNVIHGFLNIGGVSGNTAAGSFYSAVAGQATAQAADASPTLNGILGGYFDCTLTAAATGWSGMAAIEADISTRAGSSVKYRSGINLVIASDSAVQGSLQDSGYSLTGGVNNTAPLKIGWALSGPNGIWPIDPAGTIFGTLATGLSGPAYHAAYGVDFRAVTFSTAAYASTGFTVGPAGTVTASTLTSTGDVNVANGSHLWLVPGVVGMSWTGALINMTHDVTMGSLTANTVHASAGLDLGSAIATSVGDFSHHINLFGGSYGINVTSNRLNLVTPANVVFNCAASDRFTVTTTGMGFNGNAAVAKPTGWGAPTGTATRSTFVTSSVTLATLAEHVKALIDDLTSYGLIGP